MNIFKKNRISGYLGIVSVFLWLYFSCITEYVPKDIKSTAGILVVEGMILEPTGTFVKLSRTKELTSDQPYVSVTNAVVNLISDNSLSVPLVPQTNGIQGMYVLEDPLSFDLSAKYAIEISVDGKNYRSDFIEPIRTPEIEEASWITENEGRQVNIRISTHDPEKKIQYYRWTYKEDWEIQAPNFASLRWIPATQSVEELNLFTSKNTYYCWGRDSSKSFILGSSEKLAEAVIKNHKILELKAGDSRFSYLYSIEIKQYALNKDAYHYYQNLQKNIEEGGSLFSPLPTEMEGNIYCLTDPEESVIGFIPATTEKVTRIYIREDEVPDMKVAYFCGDVKFFPYSESLDAYAETRGILSEDQTNGGYNWIPIKCVDCLTHHAATKIKPSWWPNDHL